MPKLVSIYKANGALGLVLFLKTSYLIISQYLADSPVQSAWHFKVGVKLSKGGLPALLPVGIRMGLRSRQPHVIRLWISVCYVYKAFQVPWKGAKAVSTILTPALIVTPAVTSLLERYRAFLRENFVPGVGGPFPLPMGKSDFSDAYFSVSAGPNGSPALETAAIDATLLVEHRKAGTPLWEALSKLSGHHTSQPKKEFLGLVDTCSRCSLPEHLDAKPVHKRTLSKVHLLPEAGGKVRAIAIIDYFSQWALQPLHKFLMSLLSKIPQDGTFSQDRLVDDLKQMATKGAGLLHWMSIDISAATDSIPVVLYRVLLEELFVSVETPFGLSVRDYVSAILTVMIDRDFTVSFAPKYFSEVPSEKSVRYTRGQPMGALASFGLLSLFHHSFVQFCAFSESITFPFLSYGITGDDVVIGQPGHATVGTRYREFAEILQIPISWTKSFTSDSFWNFLSRSFIHGVEVSPASLKEELQIRDSVTRANRAHRMIERGWLGDNNVSNWLIRACKLLMYPAEFIGFSYELQKGVINKVFIQVMIAFLSPNSALRTLGFSRMPIIGQAALLQATPSLLGLSDHLKDDTLKGSEWTSSEEKLYLEKLLHLLVDEYQELFRGDARRYAARMQWIEVQSRVVKMLLKPWIRHMDRPEIVLPLSDGPLGDSWYEAPNHRSSICTLMTLIASYRPLPDFLDVALLTKLEEDKRKSRFCSYLEYSEQHRRLVAIVLLTAELCTRRVIDNIPEEFGTSLLTRYSIG